MPSNNKIRVLAIGSCGDMGRFAVQTALDFDFIDQIIIADIDSKSAPPGKMGGITGVPLAVGLFLLATGKITRTGVFAPEAGVDPEAFFNQLAPLCEPQMSGVDDLVLLTRAWASDSTFPLPLKRLCRN